MNDQKARWKTDKDGYWFCSKCGGQILYHAKKGDKFAIPYASKYCPHCGTEMDLSEFAYHEERELIMEEEE